MYYQNYEDYMRNVLGNSYVPEYSNNQRDIYPYNYYVPTYTKPVELSNQNSISENNNLRQMSNESDALLTNNLNTNVNIAKIKKMYPDIYTILNPMVEKTLNENQNKEITEELLETMTRKIYEAVEDDMNIRAVSTTPVSNNSVAVNENKNRNITSLANQNVNTTKTTTISRRPNNPTLRDLIRILLINRIIDNITGNRRDTRRMVPPKRPPMMPQVPRMSYPVMNYFSTPYPEDEYYN